MTKWKLDKITKSATEGRKGFYLMSLMYFNTAKNTAYDIPVIEEEFRKSWVYFERKRDELEAFFASRPDSISRKEDFAAIEEYLRDWPEEGCNYDMEGAMSVILHTPLAQLASKYSIFFMSVVASVESYVNLRIATLYAHGENDAAFLKIFTETNTASRPKMILRKMYSDEFPAEIEEAILIFEQAVRIRNSFVHHQIRPAIFSTRHFNFNDIIGETNISFDFCVRCINAAAKIITSIGIDSMYAEEMAFRPDYLGFQPMCSPSPYFQQIPSEWGRN